MHDVELAGKRVLLQVDYNVPLKKSGDRWIVADDTRIVASIPTIKKLVAQRCKIIILSKAGRPDGAVDDALRLDPQAKLLEKLLDMPVQKLDVAVGDEVQAAAQQLQPGAILMLENARFEPGETHNDARLAKYWASLADLIVNDAFSTSHRAHASVSGVAEYLPMVAGLQLQKEVEMLSKLVVEPKRPFVTIVGGAKISDKVEVIRNLSAVADVVLVGGGVANNFLKAEGIDVFHSYLEDQIVDERKKGHSFVAVADDLLEATKNEKMMLNGYIPLPRIIYPSDVVAGKSIERPGAPRVIDLTQGQAAVDAAMGGHDEYMYLDIGPHTQRLYRDIILEAGTVFWNGPMGVYEQSAFASGTRAVAEAMAASKAFTVVGGGDTIGAINAFNVSDQFDFVSTAGGASLEFLSGAQLPGITPMLVKT